MNKILRNFFVAAMVMLCGNMFAEEVTFSPSEFTAATSADYSLTKNGVTVSVTASTVNATQFRIFKNQYITISTSAGKLAKVVITCTAEGEAQYGPGNFTDATAGSYTFEGSAGTWTGDAAEFTLKASKAQVRATSIVVTTAASSQGQDDNTNTFKWCVPEDFDMTEYHKIIEAKDEAGNLMGTIELLSSPNKNDLFEELKDENGDKILGEDGKPQFDETKVKPAWSWKSNNPEANMSLSIWEEGFGYGIIGKGNPVMSQEEGWVEGDNGWSYKVWDPVYWTPGCGALPKQGEYIKVTPTADGDITVGVFINKGGGDSGHGHRLYIIDESTKDQGYLPISHERIKVKGTFQNNTWIPEEKKIEQVQDTNADGTPKVDEAGNPVMKWVEVKDEEGNDVKWYPFGDSPVLPMDIPMTENYSIFEYTNQKGEVTFFNRPFLGLITFDVKKDITYWMLNPTSQLGFYGFKLVTKNSTGINNIKTTVAKETPTYNLAGQRVDANYKGIVVKNGVKFMQK